MVQTVVTNLGNPTKPEAVFSLLKRMLATASHPPLEQGHAEVVALLLEAKADAAVVDDDKESALALASKRGHEEIATSLLNAGVREEKASLSG